MKILIKSGKVTDPSSKLNDVLDILIEDGKIAKISKSIHASDAKIIKADKKIVCPGFIDVHVHLREPGDEHKETIKTGTLAAAKGGFTSVVAMPNTNPVIDNKAIVNFVMQKAKEEACVNVFLAASLTKKGQGEEISNAGSLKNSGVVALSDDGFPTMSAELMRRAMEYTKTFDLLIAVHCEDTNLTKDGVMNEGFMSTRLGLRGMPRIAEDIMVARNIYLSEYTECRLHIQHVSSHAAVEMIRQAKRKNISVTAETCPHYFTLTDEALEGYNVNAKMNPPLRSKEDVKAVIAGLKDGTIDCIASDHAPHSIIEKELEFNYASFGVTGLETEAALVMTKLVNEKIITMNQAVELLSNSPAKIFNIEKRGSLKEGNFADITILDMNQSKTVNSEDFVSKGKNSPFIGWKLEGWPIITIVNGKVVYGGK